MLGKVFPGDGGTLRRISKGAIKKLLVKSLGFGRAKDLTSRV
jgi:hypothetical protein